MNKMKDLTDLQFCACVLLKYSLFTPGPGLYAALIRTLIHEMGMDIAEVLRILSLIKLTNNMQDFSITTEYEFSLEKILRDAGISIKE